MWVGGDRASDRCAEMTAVSRDFTVGVAAKRRSSHNVTWPRAWVASASGETPLLPISLLTIVALTSSPALDLFRQLSNQISKPFTYCLPLSQRSNSTQLLLVRPFWCLRRVSPASSSIIHNFKLYLLAQHKACLLLFERLYSQDGCTPWWVQWKIKRILERRPSHGHPQYRKYLRGFPRSVL